MKCYIISIIALMLVSACSENDNIAMIKNSYLYMDKSVLLGDVLEKRDICDNTEWIYNVDKFNRKTVVYKCSKNISSFVKSSKKNFLESLISRKQGELDFLMEKIGSLEVKISKVKSDNAEFEISLSELYVNSEKEIALAESDIGRLQSEWDKANNKQEYHINNRNKVNDEIVRVKSLGKDVELSYLSATCLSDLMGNDSHCQKSLERFMYFKEVNPKLHQEILRLADNAVNIYKDKNKLKQEASESDYDAYGLPKGFDELQRNEYANQKLFTKKLGEYLLLLDDFKDEKSSELIKIQESVDKLSKPLAFYSSELNKSKSIIDKNVGKINYLKGVIDSNEKQALKMVEDIKNIKSKISSLDSTYKNKAEFISVRHNVVKYVETVEFTLLLDGGFSIGALNSYFIAEDGKVREIKSDDFSLKRIYSRGDNGYLSDILNLIVSS